MFEVDPILLKKDRESTDFTNFPKEFVKMFNGLDSDTKDRWYEDRFKCKKYHLYLAGFGLAKKSGEVGPEPQGEPVPILGMDFQNDPHSQLFKLFLQKRPGEDLVLSDLETLTKKMMILWPRGLFKDLDVNTPVPTPKGFTRMGDLQIGDEVFSDTGGVCHVTGLSPVFTDHVCYELEFSTGEVIVAGEDHLWLTDARTDIRHTKGSGKYNPETQKTTGRSAQRKPSIKTTKQIAETLGHNRRGWFEANHRVPISNPVQIPDVNLTVPPYVLGAWLGDGTSSAPNITGVDLPIIDEIRKEGQAIRLSNTDLQRWEMSRDGLVGRLRKIGVFKNKHIPMEYLRASYSQRLALLQGLMDTDGTCSKDGLSSFTGTNRRLVENCRELVASLGLKPSAIGVYDSYVGKAANKTAIGKPTNIFNFVAYRNVPVFRLPRKYERQPKRKKISLSDHRQIVRATKLPPRPTKCIMVDSPSHLYLVGEGFIPTHNTSAVVVDTVQTILNYPNIRLMFLTGGAILAKKHLARVKRVFEQPSRRFKFLFPEFCTKSVRNKKIKDETDPRAWTDVLCKMGTAYEFTVPCRTNTTFAEATFTISTSKSIKAGSHYDIIYIDDLVHEQNYKSVTALEKCYQDYKDICPLLDPSGFMVLTGTRYSFGDTYERIQEAAKEEEKQLGHTIWRFAIRDCWSHPCAHCPHSDVYHDMDAKAVQAPCNIVGCNCPGFRASGAKGVLFPKTRANDKREIGHTLDFLEGEKIRLGPEFFGCQYENLPIATDTQTFTEALVGGQTLHFENQLPSYAQSFTFIMGDLAYVGEPDRDYSVLFVCRVFQGRIYVIACRFGNWDSQKIAENLVETLLIYRPNVMFCEKFNGWEAYNHVITTYAKEKNLQITPIQWLKLDQTPKAKTIRIGMIKGPLGNKRLWLYASMLGYAELVKQLVKWPKLGRHDDFADCLGMVVCAPTNWQSETPPPIESGTNWLRKFNDSNVEAEPDTRPAGSYGPDDYNVN